MSGDPPASCDARSAEERLKQAAMVLIERDGILSGMRLSQLAADAGVNRALAYRYFGSRQQLLREALKWEAARVYPRMRARQSQASFVERRLQAFIDLTANPRAAKLMMTLVLDGDETVRVTPLHESTMARLETDVAAGDLPPDAPLKGIHAFGVAVALGYAVLRERLAEELDISTEELDKQVRAVRKAALDALVATPNPHPEEEPS